MKNLFLLSSIISIFLILQKVNAQVYTIPWAQVQPEWVFPLWFEDATGAKDTLYLSYDSNSGDPFNNAFDSIYGDNYLVPLDTSKFQAYFGCSLSTDLLVQNSICSKIEFLTPDICFINCQLPLIMRWDVNMFRSNALPFPDQSPAPRAQGLITYDFAIQTTGGCPVAVLISDTFYNTPPADCYQVDSATFINTFGGGMGYLQFLIQKWTGIPGGTSIEQISTNELIHIYPNPFNDLITIILTDGLCSNCIIEIYDLTGRLIFVKNDFAKQNHSLDLSILKNGTYLIHILNNKKSIFSTIITKL